MDKYEYGIFIFRRDLRIVDNLGLVELNKICKNIIPIFIFDPAQVDLTKTNSNYLSFPALQFLSQSVEDLNLTIKSDGGKLLIFYGEPVKVLEFIINKLKTKSICVGFNYDYSKYSVQRDKILEEFCAHKSIRTKFVHNDFTLLPMDLLIKQDGSISPYKQFGAFRKNLLEHQNKISKIAKDKINWVSASSKSIFDNFKTKLLESEDIKEFVKDNIPDTFEPNTIGSRDLALKILSSLKKFNDYNEKRDTLSYNTTHLSSYLNFGLISEREFYWAIKSKLAKSSQLIIQIIWRDYYLCLLRFEPNARLYTTSIDPRYNKLKWTNTIDKKSKSWKEWEKMMNSQTGFLLVDAAINEIKTTGFMHNRCRLIVGFFSTKYLMINPLCPYIGLVDWFSRHLIDCISSQNKLNSQWITELDFSGKKFAPSSAVLSGRPFNIGNEMIKKWDPECVYIKKWLPHLKSFDNKILYNWEKYADISVHPKPMFNSKERYNEWIKLCEKANK